MPIFTTVFARPALALAAAAITATTFGAALATPAQAATVDATRTVLVRLDAADLTANGAATTIHQRIADAARKVCAADGVSLREQMASRQCYANAVRSAETQLVAQRDQAKGLQQTLATAVR